MHRISTRLAMVAVAAAAAVAASAGTAAAEPNTPDRPGVAGGTWELRDSLTTGPATTRFGFGRTTDFPITGDWDGDGVSTPGIVRAVNGNWVWYLRNSNSAGAAQLPAFAYGKTYTSDRSGDIPIVGDWDGDGADGPGVVRWRYGVAAPRWLLRDALSSGSAQNDFVFGGVRDVNFYTGDWDGNGSSTPGLIRGGAAVRQTWLLRNANSSGGANLQFQYGSLTHQEGAIIGDWDGDGRDGIGLIREENGRFRWLLRETASAGNAQHSFVFGNSSLWPVVWN